MTVADPAFASLDETPSHGFRATFAQLIAMSWPIMLGALAMAALQMGQVAILGHAENKTPLFLLSMMQPWYVLFFALLEAVAITAQVFSAKSCKAWPKGGVRLATPILAVVGLGAVALTAWATGFGRSFLVERTGLVPGEAAAVLPSYLITLAPFVAFEVFNGAMRGQGRTLPGFVVLALAVAANLGTTWYLVRNGGQGFDAVLTANLVSGAIAAAAAAIAFFILMRGSGRAPLVPTLMRTGILTGVVGLPVFLSLVVSFFSSAVLFDLISGFQTDYASGFLLSVRVRFFFLIPAIALATSLGVLLNQDDEADRTARLRNGMSAIAVIYVVLTALLFLGREQLVGAMIADPGVADAALHILLVLMPTFLLVSVVVPLQVILENLGRGGRVLVWTVLLEGGTCAALLAWANSIDMALAVMLGAALAYGLAFALEYALLLRHSARAGMAAARNETSAAAGAPVQTGREAA